MRLLYLVTYDICDDKRLRSVFRLMRGYGDHLQYSVFRCQLSNRERVELVERLIDIIHQSEDQVLFFPLGPAGGERERSVHALGKPYLPATQGPRVI